jgi:hypothetical protein
MRYKLASSAAGIGQAEAIDNVVQARFQKLKKRFTGHAALSQRVLKDAPKLTLQ